MFLSCGDTFVSAATEDRTLQQVTGGRQVKSNNGIQHWRREKEGGASKHVSVHMMQAWHGMAWHRLRQLGGSRTSLQPDASGRRHPPRIAAASLIRLCGQAELIVSYPAFCLLFWARMFVWFHQHHACLVFCFSVAVFFSLCFVCFWFLLVGQSIHFLFQMCGLCAILTP